MNTLSFASDIIQLNLSKQFTKRSNIQDAPSLHRPISSSQKWGDLDPCLVIVTLWEPAHPAPGAGRAGRRRGRRESCDARPGSVSTRDPRVTGSGAVVSSDRGGRGGPRSVAPPSSAAMAWTKYQLFLAGLMLVTGSINTLSAK